MQKGRASLLPLLSLAVACGSEPDASRYSVRDSAGIRIVESVVTAESTTPWSVAHDPVFRVGWDEDLLFEGIVAGVVLEDGRIVVADGGSKLIHVLTPTGDALSVFGGEGQGPSEFGQLNALVHVGGDTVLVQDGGNGRLVVFATDVLIRSARFIPWIGDAAYGVRGRVADRYALWVDAYRATDASAGWHSYPVLGLDLGASTLDTLADVGLWYSRGSGDANPIRVNGTVAVAGNRVVYGTGDRAELTWIDGGGRVLQIARWDGTLREAGEAEWESYEAGYRARYDDRYEPAELERRLASQRADFSGPVPHFSGAFGDRDGRVWLTEYQFNGSGLGQSTYAVVAPDGRHEGSISFPRPIRLLDVTRGVVLGVEYNELDVQAVVVYRLEDRDGGSV